MTRLRLAALVVLVPALLAGCSDDPEPIMPDPTTAAASPTTPSPSGPAEPTLPPEAAGESKKAAIAFADYFFDVLNYISATGDTDPLRDVTALTCQGCVSAADVVEKVYERGGTITGGEYAVRSVRARPLTTDGKTVSAYEVTMRATTTDQVVSGAGKKLDGDYVGDDFQHTLSLQPTDGEWAVNRWDIEQ